MDELNLIQYNFSEYLKMRNKNNIITKDDKCVGGIRYYNIGLEQDPIIGTKTAKGDYYLISPIWINAMAEFISNNIDEMQKFTKMAYEIKNEKYDDYLFFVNASRELFNKSLIEGLKTKESINQLLMATWLIMSAAEVDNFPFTKYTEEERNEQKNKFYKKYLNPNISTKYKQPRYDLLQSIALERFAINNELAKLKYPDPEFELKDGFKLSKRVNSLMRHFISIYEEQTNEDHIINALYCFHVIYCNLISYPEMNDITKYG
jgi:hypothetical protein